MNGFDYLACALIAIPVSAKFDFYDFFPPSPWNYT